MSIKEGLLLFSFFFQISYHSIIIESDSKNVVFWANDHSFVPWRMKYISNHIEQLRGHLKCIPINHIFREANYKTLVFMRSYWFLNSKCKW